MKILFINKYDIKGGAAVVAFRLSKALHEYHDTQNHFLTGIKQTDYSYIIPTRKQGFQNNFERGVNLFSNLLGLQYFYFPISTKTILRVLHEFKPDIVSLHNIHGGYFKTSLLSELSKVAPIVWTLHDMWAFTANSAHTFDDDSWKNLKSGRGERKQFPPIGINTGKFLIRRKASIYSKSKLTLVTPSRWLNNLASQSPLFKDKKIYHIPNGVNLNTFYPLDKMKIRNELKLPLDKKILLFSAEKVMTSSHKGGKDLLNILEELDKRLDEKVVLVIIGIVDQKIFSKFQNYIVHCTGYLFDEESVAKYLASADLFIYPTRADNLPNTLIESAACGTPSITYDIGGCKEIIKDNFNGYVIPPFDIRFFVDRIIELLSNKNKRLSFINNGLNLMKDEYSIEKFADNYYKLFQSLLK